MIFKNSLLFSFFMIGSVLSCQATHADKVDYGQVKKVVYAFDFDKVVSYFDTAYWARLMLEYVRLQPVRTGVVLANPWFWFDVRALAYARAYDASGHPVIGAEASIAYLVAKYMTWATEQDKERFHSAVSAVVPNDDVIDYATQLTVPYVVWTNNDPITYGIKVTSVNGVRAKADKAIFEPVSVHTSVSTGAAGSTACDNTKTHTEYFQRVYSETCAQFGLQPGELLVIFIDDNYEYVENARKAATEYGFPIKAYQYASSMKYLIKEFQYDDGWFDIAMQLANN